jgi:hypothetical protein
MAEVLRQFGFEESRKQQLPLLARDYVFAADFPAARPFKVVHERAFLEETPLALVREIHLENSEKPHTNAKLTLALCWEGFADAMTLLERFVTSFQRAVPTEAVWSTVTQNGIGDFGVAWAWERGPGALDVIAYVRFNVLVAATGHDMEPGFLLALANQIDGGLRTAPTTGGYTDQTEGLLSPVRKLAKGEPRVSLGGRLDLGKFDEPRLLLFFQTSSGSVYRDHAEPQKFYYRAGRERGPQEITLYRVGQGILPIRERLKLEVV